MADYKTFNIEFKDWNENDVAYYEVATDIKDALDKFYCEIKEDGCGLTRIIDIYESKADNYYTVKYDDGDTFEYRYDDASQLFYNVSKHYAFDDCQYSDAMVIDLVCEGRPVRYMGWMPGMRMQYRYADTNEVVWDQCYEQWDH